MFHFASKAASRAAVALAFGGGVMLVAVPAASADTATATAQAVSSSILSTSLSSASNDGTQPTQIVPSSPSLGILQGQGTITAGALQQEAVATASGTSSGCAGIVGNGATIQVGQSQICDLTTTQGETGGVTIGGGTSPLPSVISATAIVETCTASSDGTLTAKAQFVDASIAGTAIPVNPAPNTNLLGLINLNTQSVSNGVITATALSIPLLGINIGTVTCGPNAATGTSSLMPVKSVPIAVGTAGVGGLGVAWWLRRRRRAAAA